MAETTKIPRGPNAERRAATRAKLLDAGVRCLAEFGYAATSTPLVARLAHVSRGSLLHQFPAKVDLILAVAEHAARAQGIFIREQVTAQPAGPDRFVAGVDALWAALKRPESVALAEIMLATRNDPELAQRSPGFARGLERAMHRGRQQIAADLGVEGREDEVDVLAHLTLAALRGLAMETLFAGGETEGARKVVDLLKDLRLRFAAENLKLG